MVLISTDRDYTLLYRAGTVIDVHPADLRLLYGHAVPGPRRRQVTMAR
jgi:hypothetical protein